jgi:hypothetical protein
LPGFGALAAKKVEPTKQPARQLPEVQTCCARQLFPSARLVQEDVETSGWQRWQALPGFASPSAYEAEPR